MENYYGPESTRVRLDDYICDLNLEISQRGYVCYPFSAGGFSYMWGGCKASHGVRSGKVCYEVKITRYCDVIDKDISDIYLSRIGWSTDSATLQLGEDKNSFGFGGTGKKSVNRKFTNYGRRFERGDVVGCYLSMENGWVDISYSVNGRYCGSAFKIRWMTDEALFPHVLTKNCELEVNFGQAPHPYFSLQPGYKLIDHTLPEYRVPAVRPPLSQHDCEVVMMVGLPGVGKTTWAMNYAKIHPSKKYAVLGTDSIIDKMRVMGLPRKSNFGGRWDVLIKQATDCFNTLLKKASNLPRNLILDQTNVYASARRRKVKQYREKGYTINAMVLVPHDEDMIRRSAHRTLEEGKEVPETAVLDMKANFSLPHESENLFDNITFLELQREEAQKLVHQYNIEALHKGHKSNQRKGVGIYKTASERQLTSHLPTTTNDTGLYTQTPSSSEIRWDSQERKRCLPESYHGSTGTSFYRSDFTENVCSSTLSSSVEMYGDKVTSLMPNQWPGNAEKSFDRFKTHAREPNILQKPEKWIQSSINQTLEDNNKEGTTYSRTLNTWQGSEDMHPYKQGKNSSNLDDRRDGRIHQYDTPTTMERSSRYKTSYSGAAHNKGDDEPIVNERISNYQSYDAQSRSDPKLFNEHWARSREMSSNQNEGYSRNYERYQQNDNLPSFDHGGNDRFQTPTQDYYGFGEENLPFTSIAKKSCLVRSQLMDVKDDDCDDVYQQSLNCRKESLHHPMREFVEVDINKNSHEENHNSTLFQEGNISRSGDMLSNRDMLLKQESNQSFGLSVDRMSFNNSPSIESRDETKYEKDGGRFFASEESLQSFDSLLPHYKDEKLPFQHHSRERALHGVLDDRPPVENLLYKNEGRKVYSSAQPSFMHGYDGNKEKAMLTEVHSRYIEPESKFDKYTTHSYSSRSQSYNLEIVRDKNSFSADSKRLRDADIVKFRKRHYEDKDMYNEYDSAKDDQPHTSLNHPHKHSKTDFSSKRDIVGKHFVKKEHLDQRDHRWPEIRSKVYQVSDEKDLSRNSSVASAKTDTPYIQNTLQYRQHPEYRKQQDLPNPVKKKILLPSPMKTSNQTKSDPPFDKAESSCKLQQTKSREEKDDYESSNSLSHLSRDDFDKLKASLVKIRQHNTSEENLDKSSEHLPVQRNHNKFEIDRKPMAKSKYLGMEHSGTNLDVQVEQMEDLVKLKHTEETLLSSASGKIPLLRPPIPQNQSVRMTSGFQRIIRPPRPLQGMLRSRASLPGPRVRHRYRARHVPPHLETRDGNFSASVHKPRKTLLETPGSKIEIKRFVGDLSVRPYSNSSPMNDLSRVHRLRGANRPRMMRPRMLGPGGEITARIRGAGSLNFRAPYPRLRLMGRSNLRRPPRHGFSM